MADLEGTRDWHMFLTDVFYAIKDGLLCIYQWNKNTRGDVGRTRKKCQKNHECSELVMAGEKNHIGFLLKLASRTREPREISADGGNWYQPMESIYSYLPIFEISK